MNDMAFPDRTSALSGTARDKAARAMRAGHWQARMDLCFEQTGRGSRLVSSRHKGPLHVQKAFYPEGPELAHCYWLHPPGGLVSGDSLDLSVQCLAGGRALLTTPGAGRIYRARADRKLQRQRVNLRLAGEASLEWFPLETLVYDGCQAQSEVRVDLDEGAHFIGWDICCLGLPASRAPFASGSLRQRFEIRQGGGIQVLERLQCRGEDRDFLQAQVALAGYSCIGLMAIGPVKDMEAQTLEKLIENLRALTQPEDGLFGVSQVGDWLLPRYLGPSAEAARRLLVKVWRLARPALLNRPACEPRIWAC